MAFGMRKFGIVALAKVVVLFIFLIVIIVNVFSSPVAFNRSVVPRFVTSRPGQGEIGPSYIRGLSEITNSELLHFILTNGTGDVSKGGRMSTKLIEPFVERLQAVEELENMREKSLKILEMSLMKEQRRRKAIEKIISNRKINDDENDDDDDDDSDKTNYHIDANGKYKSLESERVPTGLTVNDIDCVLDKMMGLSRKKREESDGKLFPFLVQRMLNNAIVKPPPSIQLSSTPRSSSSSSLSSSPSKSTGNILVASYKQKTNADTTKGNTDVNRRKIDDIKSTKVTKDDVKYKVPNVKTSKGGASIVRKTPLCNETRQSVLVGRMAVQTNVRNVSQLQSSNMIPGVEMGGHFRPAACIPSERIAIIIPFRDRDEHLAILLLNLFPVLKRQGLDFTVFVIDENMPTPFNRGMLFNVGFLEADKISKFDCYIFHDVDLIPINDNNIYQCDQQAPKHFLAGVDIFKYTLPYKKLFGGVVAFTRSQYLKINGASNLYFGWGAEDDDLRRRSINRCKRVVRTAKNVGLYDMIKHDHSSSSNKINPVRSSVLTKAIERQDVEGLNTTIYHVTAIKRFPLYTKINVDINFEKVLKTAPGYLSKDMQALRDAFTESAPVKT